MSIRANTALRRGGPHSGFRLSDTQFALIVVGLVIAFNVVMVILPLIYSLQISTHETNIILRTNEFIGLKHYQDVITRDEVLEALVRTLQFTAVSVLVSLVAGLGMALVLNEEFPGRGILRALVLLPWAVSEVVTATMWIFIVNPTFGVLSGLAGPLGLAGRSTDWMGEGAAIYWVATAFAWHLAPLATFFFLAALQTVPRDLYRAAVIDRAGPIRRFIHVTLPHLKYVVLIVLVVVTVEAFRVFDIIFAFTRGGPGKSTQTLSLLIYRYTFEFSQYGLAAATSYLMIAVALVLTAVYFVLLTFRRSTSKVAPGEVRGKVA